MKCSECGRPVAAERGVRRVADLSIAWWRNTNGTYSARASSASYEGPEVGCRKSPQEAVLAAVDCKAQDDKRGTVRPVTVASITEWL